MRALGEIWLDYYYDFSPRETQKEWFDGNSARMKDSLTRSRVDSTSIRTDQDYVKALMGLFARRA